MARNFTAWKRQNPGKCMFEFSKATIRHTTRRCCQNEARCLLPFLLTEGSQQSYNSWHHQKELGTGRGMRTGRWMAVQNVKCIPSAPSSSRPLGDPGSRLILERVTFFLPQLHQPIPDPLLCSRIGLLRPVEIAPSSLFVITPDAAEAAKISATSPRTAPKTRPPVIAARAAACAAAKWPMATALVAAKLMAAPWPKIALPPITRSFFFMRYPNPTAIIVTGSGMGVWVVV